MTDDQRLKPIEVARRVVAERYPHAMCAIATGSWLRGEATATSDIDLVVVDESGEAPLRESFMAGAWPVEAFVHTRESLLRFFAQDGARAAPSLPMMCSEGTVLVDRANLATGIIARAERLVSAGPAPLEAQVLEDRRYALTDLLDDFTSCDRSDEGLLLAAAAAEAAGNLLLAVRGAWGGHGKWLPRALARYDPALREHLAASLEAYAHRGDEAPLIAFVETVLQEAGGCCFDGYRRLAPPHSEATGV
jgi:hypothetical protein